MSWWGEWGTFAAAILVVFAPGALAAFVVGFRGFSVLAWAAPLSLAAIGAASVVGVVIPFRWGVLAWLVSAALLLAAAFAFIALRRRSAQPSWAEPAPPRAWSTWMPFVAAAMAAGVMVPRLLWVFGEPVDISQTFDNVHHLNAVRYILDTGLVAPTRQLIPGFYPSLWQALTATVVALGGAGIPEAVNVVAVVVGCLVWPVSCIALVRQIVGASTPALLAAGALSAGLSAFPLLLLDFGVLYPNVLALALLPGAFAAVLLVAGVGAGERPPRALRWLLAVAAVSVLALAHPSALMALFAVGVWPAGVAGVRWYRARRREGSRRPLRWGIGLWAGGLAVVTALLLFARPSPGQAFWGPSATLGQAVAQVVLVGPVFQPVDLMAAALVLAGILTIVVRRRGLWWLVAGWATLAVIYVVCAAVPAGILRYGLTGTWYSDLFRVGALLPLLIVPLGAIGFAALVQLVGSVAPPRARRAAVVALAVAGTVAVVTVTQVGSALSTRTVHARGTYALTSTSPLLTTEERRLLQRLPQHVPADEVVVGSPWTGTSLAYALADRHVLLPHIYADLDAQRPPDVELLLTGLNRAASDPDVCAAVERLKTWWVVDFGTREIHDDAHPYPGLAGLEEAGVAELVDETGPDARLYRVTACDR